MKNKTSTGREKREYFRIKYPHDSTPKLLITDEEFNIIDISEQGIKFDLEKTIQGIITFHDGESLSIEGKFLRTQSNEIVIQPIKGIPSERITKEQKYLMKKYVGFR
jgi:hypothetical protein